ncbi:MAG: glycosyltransferase [Methyloceanibacter sp.]|nr:glycosyltransferase [Methyloceanibacter sp.]
MTSTDLPISVIVPVCNGAGFLAEAIASVRAQDPPVAEIIVVDDGSTDGSGDLAETLGSDIRVIRQDRNVGPAAARNCGITAAIGATIGFLDVDDLWTSDATSLLLSGMRRVSQPAIAAGRIKVISGPFPFGAAAASPIMEGCAMHFGSCLIRRHVFDDIGLLDPALRYGEDTDWFMRARERGVPIAVIDAVTMIHRRHEGNMTLHADHTVESSLEVIKRSLDRRRASGKDGVLPRWTSFNR